VAGIAARRDGASVLIVEKTFDIGGALAMMSYGGLYIGGGNRLQKAIGNTDTPDKVFEDWSRPEKPMGRYSDRQLVRVYADNNLDLFDWLEKHGIKGNGYRAGPDRLDRARTRLKRRAVAQRSDGPGARPPVSVGARSPKTAREMWHRNPAPATDDQNPPRGSDIWAREPASRSSKSTTCTIQKPDYEHPRPQGRRRRDGRQRRKSDLPARCSTCA